MSPRQEITIVVKPARPVGSNKWIADATITWPDGSYDISASGVQGTSKEDAEQRAAAKACVRWGGIIQGSLNKTHPKP